MGFELALKDGQAGRGAVVQGTETRVCVCVWGARASMRAPGQGPSAL